MSSTNAINIAKGTVANMMNNATISTSHMSISQPKSLTLMYLNQLGALHIQPAIIPPWFDWATLLFQKHSTGKTCTKFY